MPRPVNSARRHRGLRSFAVALAAVAGFALAALAGIALAKTFTLHIAKNATVTNQTAQTKHEAIVVDSQNRALYMLSGDSKKTPECTMANSCFTFWPPATVKSAKHLSKQTGIKGKLTVWKRNGLIQLVLGGHPLYHYIGDGTAKKSASGQGIVSFGGTWHVVRPGSAKHSTNSPSPNTTTTTTTYPGW